MMHALHYQYLQRSAFTFNENICPYVSALAIFVQLNFDGFWVKKLWVGYLADTSSPLIDGHLRIQFYD